MCLREFRQKRRKDLGAECNRHGHDQPPAWFPRCAAYGGIELVRIMRLSRCEREDVPWSDRNSLSFDDVGTAATLDEDNLQKAMRVKPVHHGVPSADEPARIHPWGAPNVAQVFRRNDPGSRGRSV